MSIDGMREQFLAYRNGDEDAFHRFYLLVNSPLRSVLLRIGVPYEELNDVVQQAMFRIVKRAHTYDEGRPIFPWVVQIAKRCFFSNVEKRRSLKRDDSKTGYIEELEFYDPEYTPGDRGIKLDVSKALASLRPEDRLAVVATKLYGYGGEDLRKLLGKKTVSTAKVFAHRAVDKLRAKLGVHYETDEGTGV